MNALWPRIEEADAALREGAYEFGFDSVDDYITWLELDQSRRATLLLRDLGDGPGEVPDRFGDLFHGRVRCAGARLARAAARRARVPLGFLVAHGFAPSSVGPDGSVGGGGGEASAARRRPQPHPSDSRANSPRRAGRPAAPEPSYRSGPGRRDTTSP